MFLRMNFLSLSSDLPDKKTWLARSSLAVWRGSTTSSLSAVNSDKTVCTLGHWANWTLIGATETQQQFSPDSAFFVVAIVSGKMPIVSLSLCFPLKENNPNLFDFIGRAPTIELSPRRSSKENQFRIEATVSCTDSGGLSPTSDPAFRPLDQWETRIEPLGQWELSIVFVPGEGRGRAGLCRYESLRPATGLSHTAQSSAELRAESIQTGVRRTLSHWASLTASLTVIFSRPTRWVVVKSEKKDDTKN